MKVSEIKDKIEEAKKNDPNTKGTTISGTYRVLYLYTPDVRFGRKHQTIIVVDPVSQVGDMSAMVDLFDEDINKFEKDDIIEVKNCWSILLDRKNKEGEVLGKQPLIKQGKDGKYVKVHKD